MRSQTVLFLHLPKTAGTTLHRVIARQYRSSEDVFIINPHTFMAQPAEVRHRARIVRGHFWFGLHRYVAQPYTYITVLRDPIKRVLSLYNHASWDSQHNMHPQAKQHTLAQLLEKGIHKEALDNSQLRMLSGVWDAVPFGACTAEHLEQAKTNLQNQFSVVGTMEQFDETLLLMQENFNWRQVYYTKLNTAKRLSRKPSLSQETFSLVQQHNALDIELYNFAKRLCQQEITQRGPAFQQKLAHFRRINRRLNPFHKIWNLREVSVRTMLKKLKS